MDKIEARQDDQARGMQSLSSTVERIELNQMHATELNKLRFDALEGGVKTLDSNLSRFMARIEGILDGSIPTLSSKQGQAIVDDFTKWRGIVDEDRRGLRTIVERTLNRNAGILSVFTAGQRFFLVLAAIIGATVTAVEFIIAVHPPTP